MYRIHIVQKDSMICFVHRDLRKFCVVAANLFWTPVVSTYNVQFNDWHTDPLLGGCLWTQTKERNINSRTQ